MVPELEDLQVRGIFDPAEVRALVKKRRDFEFLLQRRAPRKEDYVRYIEYELKLEKLRKARTKRRGIHTSGPSDFGGVRRIQSVYQRALRKFGSDVSLWNDALDHGMRVGSTHNLSKQLARLLLRTQRRTHLRAACSSSARVRRACAFALRSQIPCGSTREQSES